MTTAPGHGETFPVLFSSDEWVGNGSPVRSIPWSAIAKHEPQALANHGRQPLKRLAERGGLSVTEILAVMEDRPWTGTALDVAKGRDLVRALNVVASPIEPAQATGRGGGVAVHELKTWPEYFNALLDGSKTFEVRKADRPFKVRDTLWLREFDPNDTRLFPLGAHTGRDMRRTVTYILADPSPFAFPGYFVMGLSRASQPAASGGDDELARLREIEQLVIDGLRYTGEGSPTFSRVHAELLVPLLTQERGTESGGGEGAEVERRKRIHDAVFDVVSLYDFANYDADGAVFPIVDAVIAALSLGKGGGNDGRTHVHQWGETERGAYGQFRRCECGARLSPDGEIYVSRAL